jgi:HPt (histidine-containing phosphotransfer) domain-containing protein
MNRNHSILADDPEFRGLLELFLSELPDRIFALRNAHAACNRVELKRLVHQLKGACGGYGFPLASELAESIEQQADHCSFEELRLTLDRFIEMLQHLSAEPKSRVEPALYSSQVRALTI